MKKTLLTAISLLLTWPIALSVAWAGEDYEKTPYGAVCPVCSQYGVCSEMLSEQEARVAIMQYYREKGLSTGTMQTRGRFIEVNVMKDGSTVDRILFDRKTGRIRSMY